MANELRVRMPIAAPGQYRWLHGVVKGVLVLNLADALFTLYWVRAGHAREANDLIDELVNEHAVLFVVTKLALVGLGSWLLWNRRSRPLAVVAIFVVFLVYYAILMLHLDHLGAWWSHAA